MISKMDYKKYVTWKESYLPLSTNWLIRQAKENVVPFGCLGVGCDGECRTAKVELAIKELLQLVPRNECEMFCGISDSGGCKWIETRCSHHLSKFAYSLNEAWQPPEPPELHGREYLDSLISRRGEIVILNHKGREIVFFPRHWYVKCQGGWTPLGTGASMEAIDLYRVSAKNSEIIYPRKETTK